jgi:hypothetical protein
MNPNDVWKTIFKMKFDLYEWKVMPFGLTDATTTFMWLINDIFRKNLVRTKYQYSKEKPQKKYSTP